ncbi:MAG: DUF1624 domain-containing protein [Hyphomicrobiales bacterium]|nr:DUF1624 domain-containing protein [Hyphomicrobiales bacterium]
MTLPAAPSGMAGASSKPVRLAWPDQLRGLALVAMVSFHLTWDLAYFRLIAPDFTSQLWFRLYGHAIASTFLMLVGVSLVLAQRAADPWPGYWRRMTAISLSATAITIVTFYVMGPGFIFFGILHCIVLASLAAVPFLFLPRLAALAAMLLAFALPLIIHSPSLDGPDFWWLGLGTHLPVSDDIRPFLPWFGMVLAGVLLARTLPLARWRGPVLPGAAGRWSGAAGRHSLLVYMLHQPLMFGTLSLLVPLLSVPPAPAPVAAISTFRSNCDIGCMAQGRDSAFCSRSCSCLVTRLHEDGLWPAVRTGQVTAAQEQKVKDEALICIRR